MLPTRWHVTGGKSRRPDTSKTAAYRQHRGEPSIASHPQSLTLRRVRQPNPTSRLSRGTARDPRIGGAAISPRRHRPRVRDIREPREPNHRNAKARTTPVWRSVSQ